MAPLLTILIVYLGIALLVASFFLNVSHHTDFDRVPEDVKLRVSMYVGLTWLFWLVVLVSERLRGGSFDD